MRGLLVVQILNSLTNIIRIVQQRVRRITKEILGARGVKVHFPNFL